MCSTCTDCMHSTLHCILVQCTQSLMITAHSATCRQLLAVSCNCRLMVLIKAVGAAAEGLCCRWGQFEFLCGRTVSAEMHHHLVQVDTVPPSGCILMFRCRFGKISTGRCPSRHWTLHCLLPPVLPLPHAATTAFTASCYHHCHHRIHCNLYHLCHHCVILTSPPPLPHRAS